MFTLSIEAIVLTHHVTLAQANILFFWQLNVVWTKSLDKFEMNGFGGREGDNQEWWTSDLSEDISI